MIGGVNGVGKSSFTGALKELNADLGTIIEEDRITVESVENPLSGDLAAAAKIRECLESGDSFTLETTLSDRKTEIITKQAHESGYYIRLFYVALDTASESIERIRNRVKRGGRDVPTSDVLRCFDERWEAVTRILPFCDEAAFYDNDNGFAKVAEYRNEQIRPVGDCYPQWLTELIFFQNNHR